MKKRIVRAWYRKINCNPFFSPHRVPAITFIDSDPTTEYITKLKKHAKKHAPEGYEFIEIKVIKTLS